MLLLLSAGYPRFSHRCGFLPSAADPVNNTSATDRPHCCQLHKVTHFEPDSLRTIHRCELWSNIAQCYICMPKIRNYNLTPLCLLNSNPQRPALLLVITPHPLHVLTCQSKSYVDHLNILFIKSLTSNACIYNAICQRNNYLA